MQRLKSFLNSTISILTIPVFLGIVTLPFLLFLLVILVVGGSEGSLDESCDPKTIQAQALAILAPTRFWSEQLNYLENSQVLHFTPPSKAIIEETSKLRGMLESAVAEAASGTPVVNKTPAERQVAALRKAADDIEFKERLRQLDANAEAEVNERNRQLRMCIARAKSKLAEGSRKNDA